MPSLARVMPAISVFMVLVSFLGVVSELSFCHCEERSDAAIQTAEHSKELDCFVARAPSNDGCEVIELHMQKAILDGRIALEFGRGAGPDHAALFDDHVAIGEGSQRIDVLVDHQ